jgi:hypothetical protein
VGRTYDGLRSRVHIDARTARANMRAALHIQHRRPNDRAYRAPNWNTQSLGQWEELMVVGDPECTLMRAQTCTQHHTYRIGARRDGPIEPQIGTKTYWSNGHMLFGSAWAQRALRAIGAAECENEREAQERAQSARVQGWDRAQQLPRARSSSVGRALQKRNSRVFSDRHTC